jgi:hypothetical protein
MAFTPCVPTTIGMVSIYLRDNQTDQGARYEVEIFDQDGEPMTTQYGDLVPHLSQGDITWLLDFMSRMRALAAAGFIP